MNKNSKAACVKKFSIFRTKMKRSYINFGVGEGGKGKGDVERGKIINIYNMRKKKDLTNDWLKVNI
jgi:hypothetical protein